MTRRYAGGGYEDEVDVPAVDKSPSCPKGQTCVGVNATEFFLSRKSWIDFSYSNEAITPKVSSPTFALPLPPHYVFQVINGVKMGEGDGTVSLISLGAMCVEGWKRKRWNPAGIQVKTIEVNHSLLPFLPLLIPFTSFLIVPS